MTGGQDPMEVAGTIGVFVLLTTVITVVVWQLAASWRAKVALGREDAYRTLAESSVRTQESIDARLAEQGQRLQALETRLATVERILKEVE